MMRVIELHEDGNTRPSYKVWARVAFEINDVAIIFRIIYRFDS